MSSDRVRSSSLTWRRLCGCCWWASRVKRSSEPIDSSGQTLMVPFSSRGTSCLTSDSGYCSTFKTSSEVSSRLWFSPEYEETVTVEPPQYIIAPGPRSGKEAVSKYHTAWYQNTEHFYLREEKLRKVKEPFETLYFSCENSYSLQNEIPSYINFDKPILSEHSISETSVVQDREETWSEEKTLVPLWAPKLSSRAVPACQSNQFLGPEGHVDIELIDESANRYSVHFPMAGFYLWPVTGLGFLVTAPVTVRIAFDSWGQHLDLKLQHEKQWVVAGPLFDVSVEPEGVITEIHLPHIISLPANEVDISWFHVAHFKDEGMVLERPARVEPFYAVLENPSFSLMGILLRIVSGTGVSVPITSTALIYYHFHPEDTKFHLYLIPSDSSLIKAIDDEEAKFHGVRLQTSPPVDPLNFGSRYIVSGSAHLEIMPQELKLSYRSPGETQVFSKVFAGRIKEPIVLEVTEKRHKTLVWRTLVKPVELQFQAASAPPALSVVAFMKEHRRHLQARLGDLNGILDDLQDNEVLTEEEKELVQQSPTQQRKNETLLRMVERKGPQALEILFKSLNQRDPYLMSYLSQQSL